MKLRDFQGDINHMLRNHDFDYAGVYVEIREGLLNSLQNTFQSLQWILECDEEGGGKVSKTLSTALVTCGQNTWRVEQALASIQESMMWS